MSETKTYVFGQDTNNMLGMLSPLLQQRGLDPNVVLSMMNNRGGDWGNNGMWWIIILFFLLWGRNGWGNNGCDNNGQAGYDSLSNLINNNKSADLIMDAIQGNNAAIGQLASTLNCSTQSIQQTINSLSTQLCQVGNQIGLSGQQTINAIQQGNMSIAQQLASCCCDVREAITKGNYDNQIATLNQTNTLQSELSFVNRSIERGFSQTGFETAQQTCALQNTINDGIQKVIAGQQAAEMRELQSKIDALREANSQKETALNNAQQTAVFSQMIGQATAPLGQALAGLTKEVSDIQCKLPQTVTLPYSCATAVPTCSLYNGFGLGAYGFGFGNGLWG